MELEQREEHVAVEAILFGRARYHACFLAERPGGTSRVIEARELPPGCGVERAWRDRLASRPLATGNQR
jgi:hypothetical protein